MARPKTNTVDYYPVFTVPSKTEQMLVNKYGNDGFVFYHRLFRALAGEDGHFYDCRNSEDMEFLSVKLGLDVVSIRKMLDDMAFWGKLHRKMWENGIIWYPGFNETLRDAYNNRKREMPTIDDVIQKTGVSTVETGVLRVETIENDSFYGVSTPNNPQRKGKEIKGNEKAAAINMHEPEAAAFFENQEFSEKAVKATAVEIPDEVLDLIDKTIELKQQDEDDEVTSPGGLRASMKTEYAENPKCVEDWKSAIDRKKKKIEKQAKARREAIEKAKAAAELDAERRAAAERLERIFAKIESLSADEYEAIYSQLDVENDVAINTFRGPMRDHAIKIKMAEILEKQGELN